MNHTALEIRPSDLIPKGDAAARRKQWFSPQARPQAREEAKPVLTIVAKPELQHDDHVTVWREHLADAHEQPIRFIARRSNELGFEYADIVGQSRIKKFVEARHQIIADVKARYPSLSYPRIGKLFGGRDHTVIIFAVKKMNGDRFIRNRHTIHVDTIVSLYNAGFCQKDIAIRAGCAASAVSKVLSERFPNRPRRVKLANHLKQIRAMFDAGTSFVEIANELGFNPSAISKFIKRHGWQRP